MRQWNDADLLSAYASQHSQEAFGVLVERYVALVYSAALRQVQNPHLAEEVTQAVFVILAQKARRLNGRAVLSGWLCRTAHFVARNTLKAELRRQYREQEAHMQSLLNEPDAEAWTQFAPLLDEAVAELSEADRNAVVLRFYEQKPLNEVGSVLRIDPDTAQKRVTRAVDKLRKFFVRRGVALSAAAIGGALAANSVHAAPAGLAKTVTAAALAKGAVASASTLTLIKGALKIMAWTKAKMAIVAGAGILLATGTATITVIEIQAHRTYPWQREGVNTGVLDQQPPQVRILPSKARYGSWGRSTDKDGHAKLMGTGVPANNVIEAAYGFWHPVRMSGSEKLPGGKFDYIGSRPAGNEAALQEAVKNKFGVVAGIATNDIDVLILKVRDRNASGLKPTREGAQGGGSSTHDGSGIWSCKDSPLSSLADFLEGYLKTPVLEQTGLTNHFDLNLKWQPPNGGMPNPDGIKRALLDQLGLELVPSQEPIAMLVIKAAAR